MLNCKFINTAHNTNTNALEITNGHGNTFIDCYVETDGQHSGRNGAVFINNHKSAFFDGCVFRGDQGIGGNPISGGGVIVLNSIFCSSSLDSQGDGRADIDTGIKLDLDPTNRLVWIQNCVFYDFDNEGIHFSDQEDSSAHSAGVCITNCIFVASTDSGSYAIETSDSGVNVGYLFQNNAIYNCAGHTNGFAVTGLTGGNITLTADPFVDGDNMDFRLNNVAGGGAECKGAGRPSSWQGVTGTNRFDVGAIITSGLGERISVS